MNAIWLLKTLVLICCCLEKEEKKKIRLDAVTFFVQKNKQKSWKHQVRLFFGWFYRTHFFVGQNSQNVLQNIQVTLEEKSNEVNTCDMVSADAV